MEPPPLAAGRPAGEDAEREARGDRNRHMAEGEKHGPDFDANRFQVNAPQDVENEKQRETGGGCGEEPPFPASGTILRKRGGVLRGNAWQTESRKDDRGLGQGIGEPGEPPMQKGGRGTAEERRVRAAGVRERCHGESLQDETHRRKRRERDADAPCAAALPFARRRCRAGASEQQQGRNGQTASGGKPEHRPRECGIRFPTMFDRSGTEGQYGAGDEADGDCRKERKPGRPRNLSAVA